MMPIDNRDLDRLSAYLDDALSASERAELERRLQTEADLQTALNDFRATRALLRALPPMRAPRSFALTPAQVRRPPLLMLASSPVVTFASAAAALILIVAGLLLVSAPSGRLEQQPGIVAAAMTATQQPTELAEPPLEAEIGRDVEFGASAGGAAAASDAADSLFLAESTATVDDSMLMTESTGAIDSTQMMDTTAAAEVQAPMMAVPAIQATQPVTEAMRAAPTTTPFQSPAPTSTAMPTPAPAQPADAEADSDAGSGLPLLIAGVFAAIIAALSVLVRSRMGRS
jgi:hypothetical protein